MSDKQFILCCIPARYHSTRLPGKPLLQINEKSIIQHVYQRVTSTKVDKIIVLTDDNRIYQEVISFGGNCQIINEECLNGTDRIICYLEKYFLKNKSKPLNNQDPLIINVQGDEPFVNPSHIDQCIDYFTQSSKNNCKCY